MNGNGADVIMDYFRFEQMNPIFSISIPLFEMSLNVSRVYIKIKMFRIVLGLARILKSRPVLGLVLNKILGLS